MVLLIAKHARCGMAFHVLIVFVIQFIVLVFVSNIVRAQLVVVNGKNNSNVAVAGKPLVIPIMLVNAGDESLTLTATFEMPENWRKSDNNGVFTVGAGDTLLRLITVPVPKQALKGRYDIVFGLVDEQGVRKFDTTFFVEIEGTSGLELSVSRTSVQVNLGERFTNAYSLINKGNQPAQVFIKAKGCVLTGPSIVDIEPYGVYHFEVEGKPELPEGSRNNSMSVWVVAGYVSDGIEIASNHSNIRLLGNMHETLQDDKFFRFPIKAGITNYYRDIGNQSGNAWQGELTGSGYLDAGNRQILDFTFRGPDQFDMALPGSYDEYRIDFQSGGLKILAGDYNYSLSPLTESARNGRGLRLEYAKGTIAALAFYHRPRFLPGIETIAGAKVKVGIGGQNSIGINYLRKNIKKQAGADVVSVEPSFLIAKHTKVNIELATGKHMENQGFAGQIDFNTTLKRLSASGYIVAADKYFPGYTTSTFSWMGGINYRIGEQSGLFFNANTYDRNMLLDTLWLKMPYMEGYRMGSNVYLKGMGQFMIYAGYSGSEDRNEIRQFHHRMKYLRLNYKFQKQRLAVDLRTDYRNTENLTIENGKGIVNGMRAYSSIEYKFGRFVTVGVFGSLDRDNRYSEQIQDLLLYGVDVDVNLNGRFNAIISYQNNQYLEDYYMQQSQLYINMNARILHKHQIGFALRYSDGKRSNYNANFAAGVTYAISLDVPIRRLPDATGTVKGSITRAGGATPANVTLHLGRHAVQTDELENFEFTGLTPGNYYLMIDPTTVAFREIPDVPLPIMVQVTEGQLAIVALNFVIAGSVSGSIGFMCNTNGRGNGNGTYKNGNGNGNHLNGNGNYQNGNGNYQNGNGNYQNGNGSYVPTNDSVNGSINSTGNYQNGNAHNNGNGYYQNGNGNGNGKNGEGVVGVTGVMSKEDIFAKYKFIIELTNGNERLRTVAGADGSFSLLGLRTGAYTARITVPGLPAIYEISLPEYSFELGEGSTIDYSPCINIKRRTVRIVNPPVNTTK